MRSWPAIRRRFSLDSLTEPEAFRLRVAVLMAVVSLASAYVTYVATERASLAASLNGTASQQAAEEQQVAQQIDAIVAQEQRLTARIDEPLQAWRQNRAQGSGVRSVFTPEAVELAIEDLNAARERGTETAGVLLNLGAMEFHRAIQRNDPARMEASAEHSRLGLELGAAFGDTYDRPHVNEVIGNANLGLALMGTGRLAEAERVYRELAADTKRLPRHLQPHIVRSAATTIEILGKAARPTPATNQTAMKELVIADTYGAATGSPARLSAVRPEVFSSILQWRATITDFDGARDTLVTQWYRHDPAVDRWYALPIVSGPLTLGNFNLGGQFHPDPVTGENAYWGNSNALVRDLPPSCAAGASYRLELYLNGRLAASEETGVATEAYLPHLARDAGFAMCRPPSFVPGSVEPGFSNGIASPDGSRGVVVYPGAPAAHPGRAGLARDGRGPAPGPRACRPAQGRRNRDPARSPDRAHGVRRGRWGVA